jgi:restriction system protein
MGPSGMGRRKRRKQTLANATAFSALLISAGVLILLLSLLSNMTVGMVESLALIAGLVLAAIVYFRRSVRSGLSRKIGEITSAHIEILTRYRAQLLVPDHYGTLQKGAWYKEIDLFLGSKVVPSLTNREAKLLIRRKADWVSFVDDAVGRAAIESPPFAEFSAVANGQEFEIFCAEELKRIGWDAHVTKKSHDQGVDVIAQKNGFRLVLQCKLYSQPVGNAAVQQIATARIHERAHFGAVVSNNRYTIPAQRLARTNRVALLHFNDLKKIDDIVSQVVH